MVKEGLEHADKLKIKACFYGVPAEKKSLEVNHVKKFMILIITPILIFSIYQISSKSIETQIDSN